MAVTSYATLKTGIADWMARSDLTSYLDDFIDNLEARLNYGTGPGAPFPSAPLRTRDMITSSDLTLSSGSAALPATFLEAKRVTAKTDPRTKLEYASPDWLDEIYPSTTASDPAFYTILGSNLIVRPVTTSAIELQFYRTIPALSDANTTNWLLTASPNAYLYGCLHEASLFVRNLEAATMWFGLMNGAIGGLINTDMRMASTIPSRRAAGAVA